jgi:hypothetical protein
MRTPFSVIIVLIYVLASMGPASAVSKNKLPAGTPSKTSKGVPLTEGECTGLGGKVDNAVKCSGGLVCLTTDRDGVVHSACITKLK